MRTWAEQATALPQLHVVGVTMFVVPDTNVSVEGMISSGRLL